MTDLKEVINLLAFYYMYIYVYVYMLMYICIYIYIYIYMVDNWLALCGLFLTDNFTWLFGQMIDVNLYTTTK